MTESKKKQAETTPGTPGILELILEKKEIEQWDPIITIDGREIARASDEALQILRDAIKAGYENKTGDNTFCEITEVQKILRAKPYKRDKEGKVIMQRHPQLGIDVPIELGYDIDDQGPRNRILWAIVDQLKGKKSKDVKRIVVKFTVTHDLKQPKWEDAVYLAKLVKYATDEHIQLGYWIVEFADKFLDETEGLKARAAKLIKTK